MSGRRAIALSLMIVWGASAASAGAQGGGASLRGRVVDPQGQSVPARVRLVQRGTGLAREIRTDDHGRFAFAQLNPGVVDVQVEATGFAPQSVVGLALEAGHAADLLVRMKISPLEENVIVAGGAGTVDVVLSEVGTVISAREIASLPLNGRNFLELALLAPGNAPAPVFDPTKANSVIVSSAGQLGRGGSVSIDGQDDNDDVVGGPLLNVPQDAVQEFQIATGRFSAESGRSGSSTINVVTRSGTDVLRGSASFFARDRRLQGRPALLDRREGDSFPFDRQQYSLTAGGPGPHGRLFWFGALEVRNQDGGVLVGARNLASRSITRTFALAPLDDLLGTARADWRLTPADDLMIRYTGQRQDDVSGSTLDRAIGSASQRQDSRNRLHALMGSWNRIFSGRTLNALSVSYSDFDNHIAPVAPGVQLTFPSIQDGSSFRVPQGTTQGRWQITDVLSHVRGAHQWKLGAELQRVDAAFDLGVFRDGRIEFVEDFPAFDRNRDGQVNDDDLLFAVTLRSGRPDQDLVIPDADNIHFAGFVQDDWRVNQHLTLNLGLRYEVDSDVKNVSRLDELNPIVAPFVNGTRGRDTNNWGPRVGFNWSTADARTSMRGGYGLYYDRVTLEIQSLERGLDGRALPIEVRAGNVFFVDSATGTIPPFAPTRANPFTGFILPGAGASGINIIDARLENPMVHQFSLGFERQIGRSQVARVDVVHNAGRKFIIGRTVGTVFNPVVGGPDRIVSLESSAETEYDGLLLSLERRFSGRFGARAAYTLSKAFNYANDDQIPFSNGPIDPNDLRREFGPSPTDRRHRLTLSGVVELPAAVSVSGVWTLSSGVPMDILMPDGQSRVPVFQRNAGGRLVKTGGELNQALRAINDAGGIDGVPLPLVRDEAQFRDNVNSVDLRVSRPFAIGRGARAHLLVEVFNLFNVTNILGVSTRNYSGFANALVRDSNDPANPGFLTSSSFGRPVSTAGGVFGSGGPRAFQLGARVTF